MKLFSVLFLFCISSSFCLNLERTDEKKYNVVLLDGLDESIDETLRGTEVPMNLQGVDYRCFLPLEENEEAAPVVELDQIPKPRDFLEQFSGLCLYRSTGWWTYELCHGKHIRQFHQERDLPIRPQDDFYLGKQVADNKEEYALTKISQEDITQGKEYYAETYNLGTPCDISNIQRQTEVRWYCTPDKTTTSIFDIKEPSSCTYIISIHTPNICKHPAFAIKKEKSLSVTCTPVNPVAAPPPALKVPQVTEELKTEDKQQEVVFYMTMDELINQLGADSSVLQEHILQQVTEQLQFIKDEDDEEEEEEEKKP